MAYLQQRVSYDELSMDSTRTNVARDMPCQQIGSHRFQNQWSLNRKGHSCSTQSQTLAHLMIIHKDVEKLPCQGEGAHLNGNTLGFNVAAGTHRVSARIDCMEGDSRQQIFNKGDRAYKK